MSEKLKNINKGDTNVIQFEDFRSREAKIGRGKKVEWDEFELMGGSNKREVEYELPSDVDPVALKAALKRIKAKRIGISILGAVRSAA